MSKEFVIYATIAIYTIFMVVVGILNAKKVKSVSTFTVGNRTASGWATALSYGTSYFSAVMFIGYAGSNGWRLGLWAVIIGVANALLGSWAAWAVLAKRTREVSHRLKIKSMPQLLSLRFNSQTMKTFTAVVIFIFLTPYSASVYKGLTSVCSVLLGIPDQVCLVLIALATAVVVIFGGYIAALKADFVQGIIMFVGALLVGVFIVRSPQVVSGGGIAGLIDNMKAHAGILPLSGENLVFLIAMVLLTSVGAWGLPHMIHKYYGIKNDKEVFRGTVISTVFAMVVAGVGYFIGSFAMQFFTAMPEGGADYIVPRMFAAANMPSVLIGVFLVLLISASVTTLGGLTLTGSSTVTMDLIMPRSKKLNEKSAKNLTRVFCFIFIVMSYVIANTQTPILDMMSYSWGILSGSFLAPYLLSLYSKKINIFGAWAGIFTGFAVAFLPLAAKIITYFTIHTAAVKNVFINVSKQGPQYAVGAMIASLIVCYLVSRFTVEKDHDKKIRLFYTGTVAEE